MLESLRNIFRSNDKGFKNSNDYNYKPEDSFDVLLNNMNAYFNKSLSEKQQFINELTYLNELKHSDQSEKKLYAVMPYSFVNKYDYKKVEVFMDDKVGMFYVYLDDKKLYYHEGYTNKEDVQKSFTYVSAEQDEESPHKYLDKNFCINDGDVVVDLGAAEGNFSLSVIDKVKEILIVEAESIWMKALHKTFEPWKDKVHIINKFAGHTNNDTTITLSEIIKDKKADAIKMDIEGAEMSVLQHSKTLLTEQNMRMAITTYHNHHDASNIKALLEECGYSTVFSDKFLLFVYDNLMPPYFRKGLIKAVKK